MRYFISQGLHHPLEVEIDGVPPCLFCGEPVTSPSMDGPLVCGACDCGRNRDGSKWTEAQAEARYAHRRSKITEYRALMIDLRVRETKDLLAKMTKPLWRARGTYIETSSCFADVCDSDDAAFMELARKLLPDLINRDERLIDAVEAARVAKIHEMQVMERTCNHCGHVDRHTVATETDTCGKCGTEANPVQRLVSATELMIEKGRHVMKAQNWTVSARYAAPGRPGNRRHPSNEDFHRRAVVGPAKPATVEAVLDLLDVPEDVRVKIRANGVVQNFVEGRLTPDSTYPHNALGMHYVSSDPDAQLVEWDLNFTFVTQFLDQSVGVLS